MLRSASSPRVKKIIRERYRSAKIRIFKGDAEELENPERMYMMSLLFGSWAGGSAWRQDSGAGHWWEQFA